MSDVEFDEQNLISSSSQRRILNAQSISNRKPTFIIRCLMATRLIKSESSASLLVVIACILLVVFSVALVILSTNTSFILQFV